MREQDIYKTERSDDNLSGDSRNVDIKPAPPQGRVWKTTGIFFLLMLIALGFTFWFAVQQERKGERPDLEEAPYNSYGLLTNAPSVSVPREGAVNPDMISLIDNLEESVSIERTPPDPEKLARAMEELRLGHQYAEAKEWESAERHLRKALAEWPSMLTAQRLLAVVFTQTGRFDQAIALLERTLQEDPFSPSTYSNLAAAYMHKGVMDKAEEMLQTGLRIRPDYIASILNLGLLYLATGRYEWSVEYLEQAVERLPNNDTARNNLAVALLRIGRYEEAREQLRALLDLVPDTAYAYFNMAITYTLERDFENAMDWVRRGAERCSPMALYQFVSDSDFNELRSRPEFQAMMRDMYGELPELEGI